MVRTFKAMPLEKQIFFSFSAASALLLLLTLCLTLSFDLRRQQESIDANISGTAAYIATLDEVVTMLEQGYPEQSMTQQLERICKGNSNLNVIAIYDRNLLRFYHTSRQETGETYVSGEERAILEGAEPYIITGYGAQGTYRSAFHMVENSRGERIGFVVVSIFTADILQQTLSLILVFALILVVALVLSQLLSRGVLHLLKDALHGHRPAELLELYRKQDEVLNAMEEGLVGTDLSGAVIYANDRARQLLRPEEGTLRGGLLQDFFPDSRCAVVAQTGEAMHNRSLVIGGHPVLVSEIPIRGEEGPQGVLSILKDKTEMQKLSDELSGSRHILDTLRFFNHEFMNKLHVILGYLQTGQTQTAMQFIMNSSLVSSQTIRETADCIRVPHLCALLIGKMMHAAENGILLTVSRDSRCREEDLLLPAEDYAAILGNLLENAIEELSRGERPVREIKLAIYCRQDCNIVTCEDTGGGIDPLVLPRIWVKGTSSKGEGRGFGLAIVRQLVEEYGGQVQIETEPGEGTCFTLTFTRGGTGAGEGAGATVAPPT